MISSLLITGFLRTIHSLKMPVWNPDQVDQSLMIKKRKSRNPAPKKMAKLAKTVKEFSSVTTVHGISYVGSPDHSTCARAFWIAAVVISMIGTTYQVVSMWSLWGDSPVITTLETISLPIGKIRFPAVTVCPQGSVMDVMDAVLYYQFEEWVMRRIEKDGMRRKRYAQNEERNSSNIMMHLTPKKIESLLNEFLSDVYPGAKDVPTKFASILSKDDPERAMENKAILVPEDEPQCDEKDNQDILDNLNQKISRDCPWPFENFGETTCILPGDIEMTYDEASSFCRAHDGAKIHHLNTLEEIEELDEWEVLGW